MKGLLKKTTVAALAAVLAAGMLSGCGEKELDGTKTVATVDGTEIPLGVVSLEARQQQAQTEAMYKSFMGSQDLEIWDMEVSDGDQTYGEQAVEDTLEQIELMYIMKEKASEYGVEITEEEQQQIGEAAAAFMAANDDETLKELAVTEDQVKTLLELKTYYEKFYDPIVADVDTEITDEECQQSAFTYVNVITSDLSDEEAEEKKELAQELLDKLKEDPDADADELAAEVSEDFNAISANFARYESEDETSAYPDNVIAALREMKEGEVAEDLIETDTGYYIVRFDKELDEDATETKKENILDSRKNELYTETTEGWLEDADIQVDEKVLKTLKITDSHSFTISAETVIDEEDAALEDAEEIDDSLIEDAEVIDEADMENAEVIDDTALDDASEIDDSEIEDAEVIEENEDIDTAATVEDTDEPEEEEK